ncbi:MAG TPA: hypothetical protein DCE41_30775, partial [Cytophagales bacterium]|nr:hypothetical protein [Cytophagales bacterium]
MKQEFLTDSTYQTPTFQGQFSILECFSHSTDLSRPLRMNILSPFLIGIGLIVCTQTSLAQDVDNNRQAIELVKLAEDVKQFDPRGPLVQIRELYSQAAEFDPNLVEARYQTGLYYLMTEQHHMAVPHLEKVIELNPDYNISLRFHMARAYQYAGEYNKAIAEYEKYLEQLGVGSGSNSNRLYKHIEECQAALALVKKPVPVQITNLGDRINSEWPDYAPMVDHQEQLLFFTSRRETNNHSDLVDDDLFYYEEIYFSHKEGATWGEAHQPGSILNTRKHDSNLALSPDGKTLYLYSDKNGGDIYYSTQQANGSWSVPEPVVAINSPYRESGITFSADGSRVYFVSDRPGHMGNEVNTDIYYAPRLSNGKWGQARNLGEEVNTPYDEESPFMDADGVTLYFSSRGWNTMGGFDVFKTTF